MYLMSPQMLEYHNYVNNKWELETLSIIECALINVSGSVTFPPLGNAVGSYYPQ